MSKVLVLCQRRKGIGNELDPINKKINQLTRRLVGDDADIKYVTPKTTLSGEYIEGEADMDFVFGNNKKTDELGRDYALIICNTCPDMNYEIIHRHLNQHGYLAITSYDEKKDVTVDVLEKHIKAFIPDIVDAGFKRIQLESEYNAILFQKIQQINHIGEYETSDYDRSSGPLQEIPWLKTLMLFIEERINELEAEYSFPVVESEWIKTSLMPFILKREEVLRGASYGGKRSKRKHSKRSKRVRKIH